ncbi:MAG: MoaD/ThiS family protein [Azospirillaceae bacterium]
MADIHFTPQLERFLACPPATVAGETVADVLHRLFDDRPRLRSYILDDQDRLRRHVAVFVNGRPLKDRIRLSDKVGPRDRIDVLQALSGG